MLHVSYLALVLNTLLYFVIKNVIENTHKKIAVQLSDKKEYNYSDHLNKKINKSHKLESR